MAQISPGVEVKEYDLTNIIPSASSSIGAFVGAFRWGPVEQVQMVPSEAKLGEWFGKPAVGFPTTDFLTASAFLSYAGSLKLVRVVNSDPAGGLVAANASSAGTFSSLVKNEIQIEDAVFDLDLFPAFVARYPGAMINGVKVVVLTEDNFGLQSFAQYATYFDQAPEKDRNEIHVVVVDTNGAFSGIAGTVLERYPFLSTVPGAKKEDGANVYVQDVIRASSAYIYAGQKELIVGGVYELTGGQNGDIPGQDDYVFGWDLFVNQEEQEDVSLLITGARTLTVTKAVAEIAMNRKDCMAFISPEREDVVGANPSQIDSNVVNYRNSLNVDSSFVVMTCNWKYVFNKYLDRYEWIPDCADIAGLCARTDAERDPWFSPAGYNRGLLKNTIKLAWNPDKTQRDTLYKNGINPVVNFRGVGPMLYGDKTLQNRPSAFDRINVRRLFILLERVIAKASRYQLFEFNDPFTRAQFVSIVEPFLRGIQGRRGIYDFLVKCDEENNPPSVVDGNSFVGDIYIKPARSINFIQLNFVAVRSGVEFSEVVGKF